MSAERRQAARELHGAGRIEEALAAYSALLAEREDDAELWHLRAIAEHQLGRAELARTSAGRAIAIDAAPPAYHLIAGHAASDAGDPRAAAVHYAAAVARKPDWSAAWIALGSARIDEADAGGAREAFPAGHGPGKHRGTGVERPRARRAGARPARAGASRFPARPRRGTRVRARAPEPGPARGTRREVRRGPGEPGVGASRRPAPGRCAPAAGPAPAAKARPAGGRGTQGRRPGDTQRRAPSRRMGRFPLGGGAHDGGDPGVPARRGPRPREPARGAGRAPGPSGGVSRRGRPRGQSRAVRAGTGGTARAEYRVSRARGPMRPSWAQAGPISTSPTRAGTIATCSRATAISSRACCGRACRSSSPTGRRRAREGDFAWAS